MLSQLTTGREDTTLYNELLPVMEIVCTPVPTSPPRVAPTFYRLDSVERKEVHNVTSKYNVAKDERGERKRSPSQRRNNSHVGKQFTPKHKVQREHHGMYHCPLTQPLEPIMGASLVFYLCGKNMA